MKLRPSKALLHFIAGEIARSEDEAWILAKVALVNDLVVERERLLLEVAGAVKLEHLEGDDPRFVL